MLAQGESSLCALQIPQKRMTKVEQIASHVGVLKALSRLSADTICS